VTYNSLFRRIPGGLTPEQLAALPFDILQARAAYLNETDAELHALHEIEPPRHDGENRDRREARLTA